MKEFQSRNLRAMALTTGASVIELLSRVRPSAIIAIVFDPERADMTGQAFLKSVRAIPAWAVTPAVEASAVVDGSQIKPLTELGVCEFILKVPGWTERVALYSRREVRRRD